MVFSQDYISGMDQDEYTSIKENSVNHSLLEIAIVLLPGLTIYHLHPRMMGYINSYSLDI